MAITANEAQAHAEVEPTMIEENTKAVAEEFHAKEQEENSYNKADEDEHLRAEQCWLQTQDEVFRQAQLLAKEEAQRQEDLEARQTPKEEAVPRGEEVIQQQVEVEMPTNLR